MNKEAKHLENVDHDYIRYANVWEDPNLLIEGLAIKAGEKVLSIASAGDNAFALLSKNPSLCVAIDLNKVQLYLTELKKVAIKNLDRISFLKFFGFQESEDRWNTYLLLKTNLSTEAEAYWSNRRKEIEEGLIYVGKFEKYLSMFAKKILPLIHGRRKVSSLFSKKTGHEQSAFYHKKWNTLRWRLLFKIFFSKRIMGWLGRDPAFLAQVKLNVGDAILKKTEKHLSSVYAQQNPILYFCLNGNFGAHVPYYLKEGIYEKVKANIDNLHIEFGYAQDAKGKYGRFDCFNLSNIFEYMNDEVFNITSAALVEAANPGARFSYWNLMVDREMSEKMQGLSRIEDSLKWAERDQGFFYKQFISEQIK